MFTRNSIVLSNNIKTPLTAISRAIGNILQLTYGQLVKQLFSNQEQGFAYDPNDLSTLYQDAAGTIPVTAQGRPVGLTLDKSKSLTLGAELNTNKFTTNLTGWAEPVGGSAVIEEGEAKITFKGALEATSANWFRFIGTYKAGKRLLVTFDATHVTGTGSLQVGSFYSPTLAITPASNGKIKKAYIAYCSAHENTTSAIVSFASTVSGDVWKISNVSVKEVLGNHAYQSVSAMRPLLVAAPQRLDYDAVDDKLITNLPAQLSGCTVIRSVPNVGTQILTNQTIPTPYNDSTDHCGLIVINRALTASETSQITKLFNKAAGV